MKLQTIKVFDKLVERVRTINVTDFDQERHELVADKLTKDGGKIKETKNKPAFQLVEKDGQFIIVDKKGKQYDEQVFETKEEADFFLNML